MDSITMPVLQVLLLAIMFLAILVEVKTGGTGAGIMFGLVAAVVFWGSQYVKGAADLFQIGLFLGGILRDVLFRRNDPRLRGRLYPQHLYLLREIKFR